MAYRTFDLVVIGGGPAGSEAATTAAALGKRVALIEQHKLGGTCLNYGCDPTDTLLHIAGLLHGAKNYAPYGLTVGSARADWTAVQSYVRRAMRTIRGGSLHEAKKGLAAQGITYIQGKARFTSPQHVVVRGRTVRGKRFVIATGVRSVIPPIEGLQETGFLTHKEAVAFRTLPKRLAIIGSMPMALEFAQLLQRFGVKVTLLERERELLRGEDREVAAALQTLLHREGVHFETDVQFNRVARVRNAKQIHFSPADGSKQTLQVDEILVMVARRPALRELHLENAGVECTEEGITVNATCRSSVPHIWAAGDVTGGAQFSNRASEQGRLVAHNAFSKKPEPFQEPAVPWIISTDPAIAHLGKTEAELWEQGITYRVGKLDLNKIDRAIMNGEAHGLVKIVTDSQGLILGAHILARSAGDMLAPIVVTMSNGLKVDALADAILPYPTMTEAVRWTADLLKQEINQTRT